MHGPRPRGSFAEEHTQRYFPAQGSRPNSVCVRPPPIAIFNTLDLLCGFWQLNIFFQGLLLYKERDQPGSFGQQKAFSINVTAVCYNTFVYAFSSYRKIEVGAPVFQDYIICSIMGFFYLYWEVFCPKHVSFILDFFALISNSNTSCFAF